MPERPGYALEDVIVSLLEHQLEAVAAAQGATGGGHRGELWVLAVVVVGCGLLWAALAALAFGAGRQEAAPQADPAPPPEGSPPPEPEAEGKRVARTGCGLRD
jgi:hypothetical protein